MSKYTAEDIIRILECVPRYDVDWKGHEFGLVVSGQEDGDWVDHCDIQFLIERLKASITTRVGYYIRSPSCYYWHCKCGRITPRASKNSICVNCDSKTPNINPSDWYAAEMEKPISERAWNIGQ
ncbi:MAG: hypothetical protein GY804_11600 [Alphaproteobacteria bacterium]|nr:hypothetical protein [Alphaproteobacteria bacterium]